MKIEVHGQMVYAVESSHCQTVVGNIQCILFNDGSNCLNANCLPDHEPPRAYLDEDRFTEWLAARLKGESRGD